MWAGAQRCPEASTQPPPCALPLGGGPRVRCRLPSPVPWELLRVGLCALRSLPTAAGRQVHRGGGLAPQARWTCSMGREQQSGVWGQKGPWSFNRWGNEAWGLVRVVRRGS